jgi:hypothetical protein
MDARGSANIMDAMRRLRRDFDQKFGVVLVADNGFVRGLRDEAMHGGGKVLWVDVCQRAVDYFHTKVQLNYGNKIKPGLCSQRVYHKFMDVFQAIRVGKWEVLVGFLSSILRGSSPMLPGTGSSQIP